MKPYQVCTHCVMDTTDPAIEFDAEGVCNHCRTFAAETRLRWFPNEQGKVLLEQNLEMIRKAGKGNEYDCIMGVSGGLDSSYLAVKMKDFGLRPLFVHVDAGWNSELAVFNIEQIVKYCGFDLFTQVIDWEEMKDLQVAYLKSGIANQDVPQDHAFFATLYHFAVKNKIQYVFSGGNIATEAIFPPAWHHAAMDGKNLLAIHRKYGSLPLKTYPVISIFDHFVRYPFYYRMRTVQPLNWMKYDRVSALAELKQVVGYKEYGRKHGESRFTKFFQNHFLPQRFGYDKRKPHYSSLIVSGLMTRDQAISLLKEPLYQAEELRQDMDFVAKKLGISIDELSSYIALPCRDYSEFDNWDETYRILKKCQRLAERVFGKRLKSQA